MDVPDASAYEANLGLATTEDLLRELISRFTAPNPTFSGIRRALVLAEMLGTLSANESEYRPVDGDD